jgi:hypothetical protein
VVEEAEDEALDEGFDPLLLSDPPHPARTSVPETAATPTASARSPVLRSSIGFTSGVSFPCGRWLTAAGTAEGRERR